MPASLTPSRPKIFLALSLLALVLGFVMIFFQLGSFRQLNEDKKNEQQTLDQSQAYLARLEVLRDNAPVFLEYLEIYAEMIPTAAGEETLLRYINYLAGDLDLRVLEVRFEARQQEEDYVVMPLVLILEGGYSNTLQFLNRLHGGRRVLRVNQILVSGDQSAVSGNKVTIHAQAFYRTMEQW